MITKSKKKILKIIKEYNKLEHSKLENINPIIIKQSYDYLVFDYKIIDLNLLIKTFMLFDIENKFKLNVSKNFLYVFDKTLIEKLYSKNVSLSLSND